MKSENRQSCDELAKYDCSQNCAQSPSSYISQTDGGFCRYKCSQKCISKKETNLKSNEIYDDNMTEISDACYKQNCGTDSEEKLLDFSYEIGKEESAKLFTYHCQKKCTKNRRLKQLSLTSSMENKKCIPTKIINCYSSQSENPLSPGSSFGKDIVIYFILLVWVFWEKTYPLALSNLFCYT